MIDHGDGYFSVYEEFKLGTELAACGGLVPGNALPNGCTASMLNVVAGQEIGTLNGQNGKLNEHLHFQVRYDSGGNGVGVGKSVENIDKLKGVTVGGRLFKDFNLGGTETNPAQARIYGQQNSLLGTTTDPNSPARNFNFVIGNLGVGNVPDQPIYIDPVLAVGYDYRVQSGPNFASVILPNVGDGKFALWLWDSVLGQYVFDETLMHDTQFFFGDGGVDRFRILGIETSAGLDPNDPQAFVTGLTFTGTGTVAMTMTPLAENVPAPATLALLALGLTGLGFSRRRVGVVK